VQHNLSARDDARRLVDDERLAGTAGTRESDRIRAVERPIPAPGCNGARRVDERERDESVVRQVLRMVADDAAIVRVEYRQSTDTRLTYGTDELFHPELDGGMCKTRFRVGAHQAGPGPVNRGNGMAVDFADLCVRAIRGQPHQAVAAQAVRLGGFDRGCDRSRVRVARPVSGERAIGEIPDFLQ
jgi:hypothetical protein